MNEQRLKEISDHTSAIIPKAANDDDILILAGFISELMEFARKFVTSGDKTKERKGLKVWQIPPRTRSAACRNCGGVVFWIETNRGKKMPVNEDGTSHFKTCEKMPERPFGG